MKSVRNQPLRPTLQEGQHSVSLAAQQSKFPSRAVRSPPGWEQTCLDEEILSRSLLGGRRCWEACLSAHTHGKEVGGSCRLAQSSPPKSQDVLGKGNSGAISRGCRVGISDRGRRDGWSPVDQPGSKSKVWELEQEVHLDFRPHRNGINSTAVYIKGPLCTLREEVRWG